MPDIADDQVDDDAEAGLANSGKGGDKGKGAHLPPPFFLPPWDPTITDGRRRNSKGWYMRKERMARMKTHETVEETNARRSEAHGVAQSKGKGDTFMGPEDEQVDTPLRERTGARVEIGPQRKNLV